MSSGRSSRGGSASWPRGSRRTVSLVALAIAVAWIGACAPDGAAPWLEDSPTGSSPTGSSPTGSSPTGSGAVTDNAAEPAPSVMTGTATAALATLAVKGRAPRTGYDRGLFGQAWQDVDHNGCDTRNDVLRRDLTPHVLKSGTNGCRVLSGALADPYLGMGISFVRGQSTSSKVQIDHVVALSDAWQKGAQLLSTPRRTAFANDLLNLLAVDGPTNQRKSDGDAATWLPPNKAYRCAYAARQIAVKAKYGLWVTGAERDALGRILTTCPSQRLPTATSR